MEQRYVFVLAALLTAIGMAVFFYKWQVLGFPVTENQETPVWTVEAAVSFDSGPGSIRAQLRIPTLTPGFRMLNENSVSRGYGYGTPFGDDGRIAEWTTRRADGRQTVYYRVTVYEDKKVDESDTTPPFPPMPVIREPMNTAVQVLVEYARERSADTASLTSEVLRRLNDPSPDANVELILSDVDNAADFVAAVSEILASARIPSRVVHGFPLSERQRGANLVSWLEVHDGDRWRYFNPVTGEESLPKQFLVWWRGNAPLINVEGGSNVQVAFAIQENHLDAVAIAETQSAHRGGSAVDFSLYSLPIRTQSVYSVLLMIPIGAFIMVIMRNMIGVDAFGTFMPVLIALAFRETKLFWGVILFTLLVTLGLTIRFLLDRLRLLLVPRLSAVLIVVVMLMLFISMTSHRMGLEMGLSVALFPMVIIAMTIERMSVVWEERGAADALRAGVGSLFVAIAAYIFMGMKWLEHLIFTFPELLLIVLAVVLLAGRYTGYRLTELRRFRELVKDK